MNKKENNYAFIDSQNVNLSIREQWWNLDWKRFRIYIKDKYNVSKHLSLYDIFLEIKNCIQNYKILDI